MTEKQRRGFAAMTPEKRKEIARLGGRTAHQEGRAHRFTSAEARQAGIKGAATRARKNAERLQQLFGVSPS